MRSLISSDYLEEQRRLHASPRGYGGGGHKWAPAVLALIAQYGARSVLDYGCGQGTLKRALRAGRFFEVYEYDPAIPGLEIAQAADLVVCTDVLEHVEPDCIDAVLRHLRELTRKAALVAIATRPAGKELSDGRDAHVLLRPARWWAEQLRAARFELHSHKARRAGEIVYVLT